MILDYGYEDNQVTLQESFERFRQARKALYQSQKSLVKGKQNHDELRRKFIKQLKSYEGVPYAQKYHSPESEEYHSELFLDCCGLIRKTLKDLKDDFGFVIGNWNQSYMFDTLPTTITNKENLKEGDLVFIKATYYNEKKKQQKHNIVHVEVWLGDGDKTYGARWQTGRVQVHQSYRFIAESYYNMQYIFKSIDTWLDGVCKSFCHLHSWNICNQPVLPQRSIFHHIETSDDNSSHDSEYSISSTSGKDNTGSTSKYFITRSSLQCWFDDLADCIVNQSVNASIDILTTTRDTFTNGAAASNSLSGTDTDRSNGDSASSRSGSINDEATSCNSSSDASLRLNNKNRKKSLHRSRTTFYIGGHNGVELVEIPLLGRGWTRIHGGNDTSFYFKWVECRSEIDYTVFREGQQIVNHIPNGSCLTSKIGLLKSLAEHGQTLLRAAGTHAEGIHFNNFYPETYTIQHGYDMRKFAATFQDGDIWICKPSGMNQGKGIFLVKSLSELRHQLENRTTVSRRPVPRIIQRYISNPLLLDGKKFDIRCYMLIASTRPYMVFYHDGYARLSCSPFDLQSRDLQTHLTNQYIQRRHPSYSACKEDTVWSMDRFNCYINDVVATKQNGVGNDWVFNVLKERMMEIMLICFKSVEKKLECKTGYFDLLGFDFMVDEAMKVWLIEANVNPSLHTNCTVLSDILPGIVKETIDIVVEIFQKKRRKSELSPLKSVQSFTTLYNGENGDNIFSNAHLKEKEEDHT